MDPKKGQYKPLKRKLTGWIYVAIFLLSFLLYAESIGHSFVLDDDLVCAKNSFVQSGIKGIKDCFTHSWYYGFAGSKDRYYRPLMLSSLALDSSLFGTSPKGYHFTNVFLYALFNSILFYLMLLIFGKENWLKAIIATGLFVIHPIHTEVVANIKSRDEILAFGALLGMLIMLFKFFQKNNGAYLFVSIVCYGLAILSKESAYAFLGLVPLILYYFSLYNTRQILIVTAGYLSLAIIALYLRTFFIDPSPEAFGIIDNSLIAISNPISRFATSIGMLGHYFYLLVFPFQLSFDYSYNQIPAIPWYHWKSIGTLFLLFCLGLLIFKQIRKQNLIVFGILFFGICFVITSNIFFLTGSSFAERFLFIPSLGYCIAVGYMLGTLIVHRDAGQYATGILILIVFVLSYCYKVIDRVPVWKSDQRLFSTGINTAPNSTRTQSFYGKSYYDRALSLADQKLKKKYLDKAIEHYNKSIAIYPGFTETYQHLAAAYEANQQIALAEKTYKSGLETNSNYFPALVNLGVLYLKQERVNEGIQALERANDLKPDHMVIHRNLGIAYQKNMEFDKAINMFEWLLEREYSIPNLGNLVQIHRAKGEIDKAIYYDQEIKKLKQLEK